ncbi:hypothetical protein AAG570_002602 [Ranatra chinensis]|uniref:Eukaryotic translation initiation factor 4E binding protein n=1 Tax=Ranatra chinensis TaxID=642074 RepID=A0ABD0Y827_9HEMI
MAISGNRLTTTNSEQEPTDHVARQVTHSQNIPSKRILINDPSQLPSDFSSTPGGTLYSTTPGGTRIVYERSTLLHLRNSPLARTPPNIPDLPHFLSKDSVSPISKKSPSKQNGVIPHHVNNNKALDDHEQFEIDI